MTHRLAALEGLGIVQHKVAKKVHWVIGLRLYKSNEAIRHCRSDVLLAVLHASHCLPVIVPVALPLLIACSAYRRRVTDAAHLLQLPSQGESSVPGAKQARLLSSLLLAEREAADKSCAR